MASTNFHNKPYTESTKVKLSIFKDFFTEWLPVFIFASHIEEIHIYDFFAGSGQDSEGFKGSPLLLFNQAKLYCKTPGSKPIFFHFNEFKKNKYKTLKQRIEKHISDCQKQNNCPRCRYNFKLYNEDFNTLYSKPNIKLKLKNPNIGKFILIDQFGIKHVDNKRFKELIEFESMDFIIFIASSFISRFQNTSSFNQYINTQKIQFDRQNPSDCHRKITQYFKKLVPPYKEYYIHDFTIKSGRNYYGLIFGSNHTLGIEKFINVCWKKDDVSGESYPSLTQAKNGQVSLFASKEISYKLDTFNKQIKNKIINQEIQTNHQGFKYVLKNGLKPKFFTDIIKELLKTNKIKLSPITGNKISYKSTEIHKAKEYRIIII